MTGAFYPSTQPTPLCFNPTVMHRLEGRPVVCSPKQLRLHRTLEGLGWTGAIDEFNNDARLDVQSVPEPILITTHGIILAGFGRWRSAIFDGKHEINCIEYPLSEEETLQFILAHHQSRRGWNDFVRIRLALTLEPHFQQKALGNMSVGGKYKGSANLPEAQRIDVRQEIARAAGVGTRNVSTVKKILEVAHARLVEALQNGTLSINRAIQLSSLPKSQQVEQFVRYSEERATKEKKASLDVVAALDALQHMEALLPGSVAVRVSRHKRTVVLVGQDLMAALPLQKELHLT
jgi:hypothetical protein